MDTSVPHSSIYPSFSMAIGKPLFPWTCIVCLLSALWQGPGVSAHPEFWVDPEQGRVPGCTEHPESEMGGHFANIQDSAISIRFIGPSNPVAADILCTGQAYILHVSFGGDTRQALVSSTYGAFSSHANPLDSLFYYPIERDCPNRLVAYDTKHVVDGLYIPCGVEGHNVVKVTSADGWDSPFLQAQATFKLDNNCPGSPCQPASGYLLPMPQYGPTYPDKPVPLPRPSRPSPRPSPQPSPPPSPQPSPRPSASAGGSSPLPPLAHDDMPPTGDDMHDHHSDSDGSTNSNSHKPPGPPSTSPTPSPQYAQLPRPDMQPGAPSNTQPRPPLGKQGSLTPAPDQDGSLPTSQPMPIARANSDVSDLGYSSSQLLGGVRAHFSVGSAMPINPCTAGGNSGNSLPQSDGDNSGLLHMAVEALTNGYVSLSFAQTAGRMAPADAILGWAQPGSAPFVSTYYINELGLTAEDAHPWALFQGVANVGPSLVVCFTRRLVEPAALTSALLDVDGVINLNWAISKSASLDLHQAAGGILLDLGTGQVSKVTSKTELIIQWHGALMSVACALLLPLGALLPHHRWALPDPNFHIHMLLQTLGIVTMAAGFGLAWYYLDAPDTDTGNAHQWLGTVVFGFVCIQFLSGFIKPSLHHPKRPLFNHIHAWWGRITILCSWVTTYLGIYLFHTSVFTAPLVSWVAPVAAVMGAILLLDAVLSLASFYRSRYGHKALGEVQLTLEEARGPDNTRTPLPYGSQGVAYEVQGRHSTPYESQGMLYGVQEQHGQGGQHWDSAGTAGAFTHADGGQPPDAPLSSKHVALDLPTRPPGGVAGSKDVMMKDTSARNDSNIAALQAGSSGTGPGDVPQQRVPLEVALKGMIPAVWLPRGAEPWSGQEEKPDKDTDTAPGPPKGKQA